MSARTHLEETSGALLLALARESIRGAFEDCALPGPPASGDRALLEPRGAFVTLKTRAHRLRGCIGRVESKWPLWETVARMARASAFEDPRFPPLSEDELDGVLIEVSAMSPLVRLDDPADVVPGLHGVMVSRGHRRGLFLPQVATEQGWDRDRLLDEVCMKAGLPADAWREPGTDLDVFTADIVSE